VIRAFADASVIFAAIHSPTGASREVLKLLTRGEIELVVSPYVLDEARNNLKKKSPDKAGVVDILVDLLPFEVVDVTSEAVLEAATYTEMKDAPVIAGALTAQCMYLLTYDRKHLLDKPEIETESGLVILTPGDLLKTLREDA